MKVVLFLLAFIAAVTKSHACSCTTETNLLSQIAQNDLIFSGRCIGGVLRGDVVIYEFTDLTVRKGSSPTVVYVLTPRAIEACGFRFVIGEQYLVYCFTREGEAWTDVCRPTKQLLDSEELKSELGEILRFNPQNAPVPLELKTLDKSGKDVYSPQP